MLDAMRLILYISSSYVRLRLGPTYSSKPCRGGGVSTGVQYSKLGKLIGPRRPLLNKKNVLLEEGTDEECALAHKGR